jgi:hypothetical protein
LLENSYKTGALRARGRRGKRTAAVTAPPHASRRAPWPLPAGHELCDAASSRRRRSAAWRGAAWAAEREPLAAAPHRAQNAGARAKGGAPRAGTRARAWLLRVSVGGRLRSRRWHTRKRSKQLRGARKGGRAISAPVPLEAPRADGCVRASAARIRRRGRARRTAHRSVARARPGPGRRAARSARASQRRLARERGGGKARRANGGGARGDTHSGW